MTFVLNVPTLANMLKSPANLKGPLSCRSVIGVLKPRRELCKILMKEFRRSYIPSASRSDLIGFAHESGSQYCGRRLQETLTSSMILGGHSQSALRFNWSACAMMAFASCTVKEGSEILSPPSCNTSARGHKETAMDTHTMHKHETLMTHHSLAGVKPCPYHSLASAGTSG